MNIFEISIPNEIYIRINFCWKPRFALHRRWWLSSTEELQREIGNLGVTVEARSLNEEEGSKGNKGRKHGQTPIKSNVADRGAQKLEEEMNAKENCVSDKEGPKEQKKRRKVVATGEET